MSVAVVVLALRPTRGVRKPYETEVHAGHGGVFVMTFLVAWGMVQLLARNNQKTKAPWETK